METDQTSTQALPAGTRIEEFVIEKVLGSGGFGITYLARDTGLNRRVVIKENLPVQFAWRETTTGTVRPRNTSGGDADDFAWSLTNFLKEAETLASLDHFGIVRVLRKFETNGTAYFVMPFVEGVTLDSLIDLRRAKGQEFSEEELKGLLERVLNALGYLHDRGIYHRDIKPGNILITMEGVPVLIDFGSARQRLSERSMTVVESAGYTPFEQLQTRGNVGPWSDLYALAATLVKAITFEAPPKAADRMMGDPWKGLSADPSWMSIYSRPFLVSIDQVMAVDPRSRWQNAGQWLNALRGRSATTTDAPVQVPQPVPTPRDLAQGLDFPRAPEGFALIPAGEFQMGDALDRMADAPVRLVQISAFYMAKHEVWKVMWDTVQAWGLAHGYGGWFGLPAGEAKAANHPVHSLKWYDAVKWCNTRSEMEGLTPCYTVGGTVYRTDRSDAVVCNWEANGYRLPTEAEWEKAARGGLIGKRFPWGDTISHGQANFRNVGRETYQTGTSGCHPTYKMGGDPRTSPVGSFVANGYGLYDMAGNVWEWCWDWYSRGYAASMPNTNPHGPSSASHRIARGGSSRLDASYCRTAMRFGAYPFATGYGIGFRFARSLIP